MKSQHRHELETNWLAQHTGQWLKKIEPYYSLILGAIAAVAVLFVGLSYFSGASAARQSEAWNTYNQAVESIPPNLVTLRESAEEYPDSPMQQWADITWADGQVWLASTSYVQNRPTTMDALGRAAGVYQSLLQETEDPLIAGRAHFGLGRVYELQSELEKARNEYLAVTGPFTRLAELRAKDLEGQEAKDTYAWLATAEGPRRAPIGPGTPGQRPAFAPGDLDMPAAGATNGKSDVPFSAEDLFKGIGETPANNDADRYDLGAEPSGEGDAKTEDASADAAKSIE
jgi:hypothetical protein